MQRSWLEMTVDPSAVTSFLIRWSGVRRIAKWLRLHADLVAGAVVAATFVIMLTATRDRHLSPDEALHFELANLPDFSDVYRESQANAHPPLFFLILRFWLNFGRSEFLLRLLPAICGAAFLWFAYRAAGRLFGKAAGFLTLLVLAFSPAFLPLSSEVRGYSLLLLLNASTLAAFEGSIEARSPLRMAAFSFLLYLAILTHYSALFVTASLFLYALIRFRASRAPRAVVLTWAGFQAGAAALYLFLYLTQVARLRGGELEHQAMTGWLSESYFHHGQESPVWFVVRQTSAVFLFFFGSQVGAVVAILFTAAGVVHLAARRRPSALLIVLPFLFGAAAGLLGLYPFGGTRHSAYLLPFAAAAIAVAVSAPRGRPSWSVLLLVIVLVPLFWGMADFSAPDQSLSAMNVAVEQLRRSVPAGSLFFADYRTGTMLSYYLGGNEFAARRRVVGRFLESEAGPYCLVTSPRWWIPDPKRFADEVERLIRVYRVLPGQHFWVIRESGEHDLAVELARRFPGSGFLVLHRLGNLSAVEFWP